MSTLKSSISTTSSSSPRKGGLTYIEEITVNFDEASGYKQLPKGKKGEKDKKGEISINSIELYLYNLKKVYAPQEGIATVFALSFDKTGQAISKSVQAMFGCDEDNFINTAEGKKIPICETEFGSIRLNFDSAARSKNARAYIERLNGELLEAQKEPIVAKESEYNGQYSITIPAGHAKYFMVDILGYKDRAYFKLLRDSHTLQRAEQSDDLASLKIKRLPQESTKLSKLTAKLTAKLPKAEHASEINPDWKWIEIAKQSDEEKKANKRVKVLKVIAPYTINPGAVIPMDILFSKIDISRENLKTWVPDILNKNMQESLVEGKYSYAKGSYYPQDEGFLSDQETAILLFNHFYSKTKDATKSLEQANKLVNECKIELFKQTVAALTLGGATSEMLETRMFNLLASINASEVDIAILKDATKFIRADAETKLEAFIKMATNGSATGANTPPSMPLYHQNQISIILSKEPSYNVKKGLAKITAAEFLINNGMAIQIKGSTGSENRSVSGNNDAALDRLAQKSPICYAFMTNFSGDFKTKALGQSSMELIQSANYLHTKDPEFFTRLRRQLNNINNFRKEAAAEIQAICKKNKNTSVDDLMNEDTFMKILETYEKLIGIDYYKDIDLFYENIPGKAPDYKATLERNAASQGFDIKTAAKISPRTAVATVSSSDNIAPVAMQGRARLSHILTNVAQRPVTVVQEEVAPQRPSGPPPSDVTTITSPQIRQTVQRLPSDPNLKVNSGEDIREERTFLPPPPPKRVQSFAPGAIPAFSSPQITPAVPPVQQAPRPNAEPVITSSPQQQVNPQVVPVQQQPAIQGARPRLNATVALRQQQIQSAANMQDHVNKNGDQSPGK
jgi:hypothetical protein